MPHRQIQLQSGVGNLSMNVGPRILKMVIESTWFFVWRTKEAILTQFPRLLQVFHTCVRNPLMDSLVENGT